MTKTLLTLTLSGLLAAWAPAALAHGDAQCGAVPKAEWRPRAELETKLKGEGWTVRRIAATPTCYEVYGKDPQGRRVEAFFNPRSFERFEPK